MRIDRDSVLLVALALLFLLACWSDYRKARRNTAPEAQLRHFKGRMLFLRFLAFVFLLVVGLVIKLGN